jgi:hypothetical protein
MPRLPDRFDLWVRQARRSSDPERQLDLILGGLMSLREVYFLQAGGAGAPAIAQTRLDDTPCAPLATTPDCFREAMADENAAAPPTIAVAPEPALAWCVEQGLGLLINPGSEGAALIPPTSVATFLAGWKLRPAQAGFWIPNLTSQEEDFWQEHGL